jgi:hypothetical protein
VLFRSSAQQSTDVPTGQGFINSLKVTATTADASIGATQYDVINYYVEGYDVADLMFGSAAAQTITFSFWIKSAVAGQYSATISNSGQTRANPQAFTVNAVNTWEKKTITYTGDTSGTWLTNNGRGFIIQIYLSLGSTYLGSAGWNGSSIFGVTGQVNFVGTLNNAMYITGVQLEKGSTATAFDNRSYGTEFDLCQRYYQLYTATAVEWIYNESSVANQKWWQCYLSGSQMRATPTATFIGSWTGGTSGGLTGTISSIASVDISVNRFIARVGMSAAGGTDHLVYHTDGWATKQISFSAEL